MTRIFLFKLHNCEVCFNEIQNIVHRYRHWIYIPPLFCYDPPLIWYYMSVGVRATWISVVQDMGLVSVPNTLPILGLWIYYPKYHKAVLVSMREKRQNIFFWLMMGHASYRAWINHAALSIREYIQNCIVPIFIIATCICCLVYHCNK